MHNLLFRLLLFPACLLFRYSLIMGYGSPITVAPLAVRPGAWALLCVSLLACSTPEYVCQQDSECVSEQREQGTCEATRRCSFAASDCLDLGRRYAEFSGALAGRCVPGDAIALRGLVSAGLDSTVTDSGSFSVDSAELPATAAGRPTLYVLALAVEDAIAGVEVRGAAGKWTKLDEQCAARRTSAISAWMPPTSTALDGPIEIDLGDGTKNAVASLLAFDVRYDATTATVVGRANTLGDDAACPDDGSSVDQDVFSLRLHDVRVAAYTLLLASSRNRSTFGEATVDLLSTVEAGSDGKGMSLSTLHYPAAALADGMASGTVSGLVDWAALAVQIF